MLGIMILLFTVVPAIEIYLLFQIGGEIGSFNTVMVIIFTGIIGASLAKSQGMSILMQIQNDMNQGALPANKIIHGLMVFAGGLLLLTPGFLTDAIGFSFVLPGPRHVLIIWVKKIIEKAMKNGNINFQNFGSKGKFYSYSSGGQTKSGHPFRNDEKVLNEEISPGIFEADFTEKE